MADDDKHWREYASGAGAAAVAVAFTFPIHKAMFRQQVHNISSGAAVRQLRQDGVKTLYRGVFSPLLMKVSSNSVMFGSYNHYKKLVNNKPLAAVLAGASEALLLPLERVQVLMQDRKYHSLYKNTPHAFYAIRVHGFTEYYRGFSAVLLRNCPGNVIFFAAREKIQALMPKDSGWAVDVGDFVGGACLGAFISTVFFPVNVTKTHMQLVVGEPFLRFNHVFKALMRKRGVRGMFRGVHVNYTRSFLSWGIVNVTYEKMLRTLKQCDDAG